MGQSCSEGLFMTIFLVWGQKIFGGFWYCSTVFPFTALSGDLSKVKVRMLKTEQIRRDLHVKVKNLARCLDNLSTSCFESLFNLMSLYTAKKQNRKFEQIFLEKELRGLSPNSHTTFMCLWAIYIFPQSVCLYSAIEKYVDRSWEYIYKSLKDTWMWKLGLRPRSSFSGNT